MSLEKFKGVFCALNAIYDENDNIDVEKIKAYSTYGGGNY